LLAQHPTAFFLIQKDDCVFWKSFAPCGNDGFGGIDDS
jgi:hypothetical protein